jgi:hypothetical protein
MEKVGALPGKKVAAGKDSQKAQRVKAKTEAREEEVRQVKEAELRKSITHHATPTPDDQPLEGEIDAGTEQNGLAKGEEPVPVNGEGEKEEGEVEVEDCPKFKAMIGKCKGKIEEWMKILESDMDAGQLKAFYEGDDCLEHDMLRAVAMRKIFFSGVTFISRDFEGSGFSRRLDDVGEIL